ncbi:type II toxin-antitoxin system VapC family toxin [Thiohalocapsa sp. ML1]|jgi:predicted nucleic acid-binding protein|uniref:type II toxin-antitoxin system VapC family toxin n=1 Tax=Thiohalocapsa sp. ML1 TaxID=1431688 RepID=UPI0007320DE6|nr:type II toxin-antitoxin system VapC family toxin [Thiohalocapsa sp. ML1]
MSERRTYLDANVLIAAWNGDADARAWAGAVLNDPSRKLVVSDYVRLEVIPKPRFRRGEAEVLFMEAILDSAEPVQVGPATVRRALALAGRHDLQPMDALHLAAADQAGVDEMVTMERPEKPLCRQTEVPVVSLRAVRDRRPAG